MRYVSSSLPFFAAGALTLLTPATQQDVTNGNVLSVTTLPIVQSVFVGVGMTLEIDQATKDIYITGMMSGSTPNEYSLIRVAQADKKITVVKKNMINDIAVLGGFSCLDWGKGHLYIEYGVNTTGTVTIQVARLDVATGALVGYFSNPMDLSSCSWDVSKGHFVGYGLDVKSDGSYLRSVVSFNPSGQPPHMAMMGTLPSKYTIMSGDCASVHDTTHELAGIFSADSSSAVERTRRAEQRNRVHNFAGQAVVIKPGKAHRVHSRAEKRIVSIDELGRIDADASAPFHLVQNTHSGAVKTAPELCATSTACPWSIEWLNAKKDARSAAAGVVVQK